MENEQTVPRGRSLSRATMRFYRTEQSSSCDEETEAGSTLLVRSVAHLGGSRRDRTPTRTRHQVYRDRRTCSERDGLRVPAPSPGPPSAFRLPCSLRLSWTISALMAQRAMRLCMRRTLFVRRIVTSSRLAVRTVQLLGHEQRRSSSGETIKGVAAETKPPAVSVETLSLPLLESLQKGAAQTDACCYRLRARVGPFENPSVASDFLQLQCAAAAIGKDRRGNLIRLHQRRGSCASLNNFFVAGRQVGKTACCSATSELAHRQSLHSTSL